MYLIEFTFRHMQLRMLLNSPLGKVFISILLGLGLATIFHSSCKEKGCIRFVGPVISEVDGKIYKHGEKCYKYEAESAGKCDDGHKRVLDVVKPSNGEELVGSPFNGV
jgi:hypothetical protein